MNIYLDNGYLNFDAILKLKMPYIFIIGGRGTGKTYGALKYAIENDGKFIFMRRKQKQIDAITISEFNPFQPINRDRFLNICPCIIRNNQYGFYNMIAGEDEKMHPEGEPLGYAIALSEFSNIRGFNAPDVNLMIYDEFIQQDDERRMKGEANALFNAYETINRNRELEGKEPVKLICLSNSNKITNPIFMELGLVQHVSKMIKNGKEISILPQRKLVIINMKNSKISEAKKDTVLYQLTRGTEFEKMAIDNDYNFYESRTKSINLKELVPEVRIGEIQIDRWKGHNLYYVTGKFHGSPKDIFSCSTVDIERARRAYRELAFYYMSNNIIFENYTNESIFAEYFQIKI